MSGLNRYQDNHILGVKKNFSANKLVKVVIAHIWCFEIVVPTKDRNVTIISGFDTTIINYYLWCASKMYIIHIHINFSLSRSPHTYFFLPSFLFIVIFVFSVT